MGADSSSACPGNRGRPAGVLLVGIVAAMCEAAVMAFPPNQDDQAVDPTSPRSCRCRRETEHNAMVGEVARRCRCRTASRSPGSRRRSKRDRVRASSRRYSSPRRQLPTRARLCASGGSAQPVRDCRIFVEGKATPEQTLFVSVNRVGPDRGGHTIRRSTGKRMAVQACVTILSVVRSGGALPMSSGTISLACAGIRRTA